MKWSDIRRDEKIFDIYIKHLDKFMLDLDGEVVVSGEEYYSEAQPYILVARCCQICWLRFDGRYKVTTKEREMLSDGRYRIRFNVTMDERPYGMKV